MRFARKWLCAVAVALACLLAIPALAEITLSPESSTVYMGSKNGSDYESTARISVRGLEKTIRLSDVKSSDEYVARIESLEMNAFRSENRDSGDYVYENNAADIVVIPRSTGSAAISVNVDGKRYSTSLRVASYVNPVKTFMLTSVSEKNLKSLFDSCAFVEKPLPYDVEKGILAIEAASGWRVTAAEWYCYNADEVYTCAWSDGVPTAQLAIPAMKADREYVIRAELMNEKTRGKITLFLQI